jgi:aspartate/methionine/tyrosine aminotransferase
MIGWRVGWIVGPASIVADVARVSISNVVCQTGIAMDAVAAAINDVADGIQSSVIELQARRDLLLDELRGFQVIPPHGGWSFLIDVTPLDVDGPTASARLLQTGGIATTAMTNWGSERCNDYLRLVYSNESQQRLVGIGERFRRSLL